MDRQKLFREIPSVDEILRRESIVHLLTSVPRWALLKGIRTTLNAIRQTIADGNTPRLFVLHDDSLNLEALESEIVCKSMEYAQPSLRRVINASGIIVHTNLGRAPLGSEVLAHIARISSAYCSLEMDVASRERGERDIHVADILCEITGAEDALVVNNNAAAVLLVLSAFAQGKEVIISRGELIEIGGSFRIPEIIVQGGAIHKEVGTPNKTRLSDYASAVNDDTAIVMKIHKSNYAIVGFTEEVEASEIVGLAHDRGLIVVEDLGSGCLVNLSRWNIPAEPTVQEAVRSGVDLITFSGDKLLGGPQAGIILGRRALVQKLRKHPLKRALRVDKIILAALEMILRQYISESYELIPVLKMISSPRETLRKKAEQLKEMILSATGDSYAISIEETMSQLGGGALPQAQIPSIAIAINHQKISYTRLDILLRSSSPPLLPILRDGKLLLDLRTVDDDAFEDICHILGSISQRHE